MERTGNGRRREGPSGGPFDKPLGAADPLGGGERFTIKGLRGPERSACAGRLRQFTPPGNYLPRLPLPGTWIGKPVSVAGGAPCRDRNLTTAIGSCRCGGSIANQAPARRVAKGRPGCQSSCPTSGVKISVRPVYKMASVETATVPFAARCRGEECPAYGSRGSLLGAAFCLFSAGQWRYTRPIAPTPGAGGPYRVGCTS